MKMIRKLLAIFMIVTLLITALPITSVSAKGNYTELVLNTPKDIYIGEPGITLEFTPEKDGTYKFYSLGNVNSMAVLYDDENLLAYNDDIDKTNRNFSLSASLKAGKTYYLEVGVWVEVEEYVDIQIVVEETTGVESIEITQYPFNTSVVEGYEYETFSADGLQLAITFTDGATANWVYDEYSFIQDNNLYGYAVDVYLDYNYQDNYFAYIECGGVVKTIPYTLVKNNVKSIEYFCETPIELYENSNGYWMDEETYFYYYDVPENAVIKINYKDGTSKDVSYYDEVDGVYFYDYSYQETSDVWGIGRDNYFYIYYLDAYVKVPVTILACPFKSVTLNSAPTKDYFFGDYETGYYDANGEYIFSPTDLTGLSFTVEYNDDTKDTYDDDDFDIYGMTIDRCDYNVSEHIITEPGTIEATIYYKGAQIKYDVDVVESYVESIEILKGPDTTEYENRYYADFTGTVVKVNYKDGTSAQATANKNTLSYFNGDWIVPQIKVGDDYVRIFSELNLETMDVYDYFTCAGVGLNYYGITYTRGRKIDSIDAKNVTMNGDGMVLNVEYANGTSEELIFDVLASFALTDELINACAMTKNGVVAYLIEKVVDDNGNFKGYNVFVFENDCFVPVKIGDADGDGEISIMDATEIQLVIAQLLPEFEDITVADVDCDGGISIMDATAIQMKLAGLI